MKRIICFAAAAAILFMFLFPSGAVKASAVTGGAAVKNAAEDKSGSLSPESMQNALKFFLNISEEAPNGDMGVREPFSKEEQAAAERIALYAASLSDSAGQPAYEIKTDRFNLEGSESQNIIAKKAGTRETGKKQIIFGANYDNALYTQSTGSTDGSGVSLGAMDNGTGVALLLTLMDYYKGAESEHDLVFIFFGADKYSLTGSYVYAEKMTLSEIENTLIMFNVKRFGGDNLYIYSEEVKTAHNDYLYTAAADAGLGFSALPKNLPLINAVAVKRIPYAHWAMIGSHAAFMNQNINVANIFSGSLGTAAVDDSESAKFDNRAYTAEDTYKNLENDLPHYKEQMSAAANLIVQAVANPSFEEAMINSRAQYKSYAALTNGLAANIALIFIIMAAAAVIIVLAKRLEKKYPPEQRKRAEYKLAVFGTDYENKDKKSDDIFGGY